MGRKNLCMQQSLPSAASEQLEVSVKVFISYAHADQELHKQLNDHLSPLKYSGDITIWHDQEIPVGANWEDQINTHLDEADLILLLVSASFIASKYCWNKEVRAALERHKVGKAQVIPIILKPVRWQNTPLGQLQALPKEAKPVTQWNDYNAALEDVVRGIEEVVDELLVKLRDEALRNAKIRELTYEIEANLRPALARIDKEIEDIENTISQQRIEKKRLEAELLHIDKSIEEFRFKNSILEELLQNIQSIVTTAEAKLQVATEDQLRIVSMRELTHKIKENSSPALILLKKDIDDIKGTIIKQQKKRKIVETDVQSIGELIRKKKTEHDVAKNKQLKFREEWNQIVWQLQALDDYTFILFARFRSFPVDKLKLLDTQASHTSTVLSVVISPDGERLVSGSGDKTIKVWNLQTGMHERTLDGHTGAVWSVAISPDGEKLVSGSDDQTIKVWNLQTGMHERTLIGHSDYVRSVAISPDGEKLVSGSGDKTIRVWNLRTGMHERTLDGHTGAVWSVVISPDGERLVSGSNDHTIKIWGV